MRLLFPCAKRDPDVPQVLITSPSMTYADDDPSIRALRVAGWEVEYSPYRADRTDVQLGEALPGIDAVIAGSDPFTERALALADRLKLIARVGVGYDAVDVAAATQRKIAITTTVGANNDAVADYAMALLLALGRQVVANHDAVRAGAWKRSIGVDVWSKAIGVIGTGLIGGGVVRRAHGFAMRILAYDVVRNQELVERYGVEYVGLGRLLGEADFVTLHVNLNRHTHHLIGAKELALMKPTAYLINTCRGPVIDEAALVDALKDSRIAGAGLDVFEREPPAGSPLLDLPNVVLAPHVAGISRESQRAMGEMAAGNVVRLGRGEPLQHVVNPEALA